MKNTLYWGIIFLGGLAIAALLTALMLTAVQATFNQIVNHTELETDYNPNERKFP